MASLDEMFIGLRDACTDLYVGMATFVVGFGTGLVTVSEWSLAVVFFFMRQLHELVLRPLYQHAVLPICRDTLLPLYSNVVIGLFNICHHAPVGLLRGLSTVFTRTMQCIVFGSQENTTQDFDNAHNICMVDGTIFELLSMCLVTLVCSATIVGLVMYRVWHACLLGLCAKILFTNTVRDRGAVAANAGHLAPARNSSNAGSSGSGSNNNDNGGADGVRGRSEQRAGNGARNQTPKRGANPGNNGNGGLGGGGGGSDGSHRAPAKQARARTPKRGANPGPAKADNKIYIIECLLDERNVNGTTEFLVKWKGYDDKHNSWEPQEALSAVVIKNFHEANESSYSLDLSR